MILQLLEVRAATQAAEARVAAPLVVEALVAATQAAEARVTAFRKLEAELAG